MMTERAGQDRGVGEPDDRKASGNEAESQTQPARRRMEVCIWCSNNDQEICTVSCQPEGKYRHLQPVVLAPGELPPSPPPYAELVDWDGSAHLAMLYLLAWYQDWLAKRE